MKKQKRHGFKAAIALSLAFVLLIGSSFAYFTDHASVSTNGTAGTLAISLDSDINLLDENGMDILNPGDIRSGSFTVTNMGNKSADIRTTIALTAYDRNGQPIDLEGSATSQSMYDLYLAGDVELVDGQGHKPKAGAQPLQLKVINGNVITYSIPEYSLNGNSDLYDEVETINNVNSYAVMPMAEETSYNGNFAAEFEEEIIPGIPVAPSYSKDCDFVLVFNTEAGNKFQGSVVRIDVIVEAKQHENTQAGWQLCEHEDITVGSLNQGVVLPENVITANGTINPGYEYTPSTSGTASTCTLQGQVEGLKTDIEMEIQPVNDYSLNKTIISGPTGSFVVEDLEPNTEYIISIPQKMSRPHEYYFTTGDAGSITQITIITAIPG